MKHSLATDVLHVDDIALAYYKSSEEKPITIVLLHGYCGSSSYYHKLIPLLETCATVVVFDLFGHGKSEPLKSEKYNLAEVAVLLHKALQTLQLSSVYMFGHSLGGYITLGYAKQFSAFLRGFGLLHSTALPDTDVAKQNRLGVIASVKQNGVAAFTSQLVGKLFGNQPHRADVELAHHIGAYTSVEGVVGFAHAMREREDAQEIIGQATIPVLLIAGEEDKIVAPEAVFAGHNKATQCKRLKGAGHMGMLEDDVHMAEMIKRFVSYEEGCQS